MGSEMLFATDFDGTLNSYSAGISEKTVRMIEAFRDGGNYFGVITGRNVNNIAGITEAIGDHLDFLMCMTGAYAADGAGNIIFEERGDGGILADLLMTISDQKCRYLSYADGKDAYRIDVSRPLLPNSPDVKEAMRHRSFSQVNTAYNTMEELEAAMGELLDKFGEKISPQINGTCLDIPPFGVTKGTAVLRMAKHFGVSEGMIFTAGDNDNDIAMLKMHFGFSVPNGTAGAKAAAKMIFPEVGDMLEYVLKLSQEGSL